jgi:hypothetical protein
MNDDDLTRWKTALLAGLPTPKDLSAELLHGIERFRRGEVKTLCRALGLRAPGMSSLETRRKIAERNAMIRAVAEHYPGDPWDKARAIHDRIRRYPRIGDEKPLYAPLFQLGAVIPGDITRFYQILTK